MLATIANDGVSAPRSGALARTERAGTPALRPDAGPRGRIQPPSNRRRGSDALQWGISPNPGCGPPAVGDRIRDAPARGAGSGRHAACFVDGQEETTMQGIRQYGTRIGMVVALAAALHVAAPAQGRERMETDAERRRRLARQRSGASARHRPVARSLRDPRARTGAESELRGAGRRGEGRHAAHHRRRPGTGPLPLAAARPRSAARLRPARRAGHAARRRRRRRAARHRAEQRRHGSGDGGKIICCIPDDSGAECEDRTPEPVRRAGRHGLGGDVVPAEPVRGRAAGRDRRDLLHPRRQRARVRGSHRRRVRRPGRHRGRRRPVCPTTRAPAPRRPIRTSSAAFPTTAAPSAKIGLRRSAPRRAASTWAPVPARPTRAPA